MRLFGRRCDEWELPYAAGAAELSQRERLALETHAIRCDDCADALRSAGRLDLVMHAGFAGLRSRRTMLAPGRARLAAARPTAPRPAWLRMPALFGRLANVSVMVGMTMLIVTGSVEQAQIVPAEPHSVIQDYFRSRPTTDDLVEYIRWLRLQSGTSVVTTRETVRFPVGGIYDVEPVEIQSNRTATPR